MGKGLTAASLGAFASTLATLVVGVIALGLLAGAVHFAIRAFEFGRIRERSSD